MTPLVLALALLGCGSRSSLEQDTDAPLTPDATIPPADGGTKMQGCIRKLTVGGSHGCALRTDGSLWCWGNSNSGQCGRRGSEPGVFQVESLGNNVRDVAAGSEVTCAVLNRGELWCFGDNTVGQLGIGTFDEVYTDANPIPSRVLGLGAVATASVASTHVCALGVDGGLSCWGAEDCGAVGLGPVERFSNAFVSTPQHVTAVDGLDMLEVSAGDRHTCVLLRGGGVRCWGDACNPNGPNWDWLFYPGSIDNLPPVTSLASGDWDCCGVTTAGAGVCWGANVEGPTVVGMQPSYATVFETPAGLEQGVASMALGVYHRCASKHDGSVLCWGGGNHGEIGDGQTLSPDVPTEVRGLDGPAVQIGAGYYFSCALTTTGKVWCWGDNRLTQLSRDWHLLEQSAVPVEIPIPCP